MNFSRNQWAGAVLLGSSGFLMCSLLASGCDGCFDVTFKIEVENLGQVDLTDVQVTDSLITTFPAPVTFNVQQGPAAAGGSLTADATYNGAGNNDLLNAGSSTLSAGGTGTSPVATAR